MVATEALQIQEELEAQAQRKKQIAEEQHLLENDQNRQRHDMTEFEKLLSADVFDQIKKIKSLQDIGYHIDKERARANDLAQGLRKYTDDEVAKYNAGILGQFDENKAELQ